MSNEQVCDSSGGFEPESYSLKLLVQMLKQAEARKKADEDKEPVKQE